MAERILLVEDEEKLARMVELELKYEGYEVEKALDGRSGLELALRSRAAREGRLLTAGPLTMDVERHQVTVGGQGVELTKKEFDLLHCLLENRGRVLSRETLLDSVWGFDFVGETNSVDVYIRFLRSKLDDVFGLKLIHTVRGVGYVIKEE